MAAAHPPHRPLPSRAVLITGCSSGIGRATAEALAGDGWMVYATARRVEDLADLADLGCKPLALDVTDPASIEAAVAHIERAHGAVGVLVNNAGYGQYGAVESVPPELIRRQFETNVFGPLALTRRALPAMRAQGWGKVVIVGSMGGRMTFPGGGAYHATKHALEALGDALRFELRGWGVDVILIEPGLIRTGFTDRLRAEAAASGVYEHPDYGAFNARSASISADSYTRGPLAPFASGPEAVGKAVARAVRARRPKARYVVGPSGWIMVTLRRWLPDWLWDAWMRRNFPSPGTGLGDGP